MQLRRAVNARCPLRRFLEQLPRAAPVIIIAVAVQQDLSYFALR